MGSKDVKVIYLEEREILQERGHDVCRIRRVSELRWWSSSVQLDFRRQSNSRCKTKLRHRTTDEGNVSGLPHTFDGLSRLPDLVLVQRDPILALAVLRVASNTSSLSNLLPLTTTILLAYSSISFCTC
jgi:hypothetical protein